MRVNTRGCVVALVALCAAVPPAPAAVVAPPLRPRPAAPAGPDGPYTPPTCVPGVPFSDITCTTGFDPWIEQFGLDGITAGCGGGMYCPGSPVTRDQMAVFIEKAMRGTAAWPAHTQIVWAVRNADGSPNPTASGAALFAAILAIPASGNDMPSPSNPWLVKVGPGVFDVGSGGPGLPAYVNLDGAGQASTTIQASADYGTVLGITSGPCTVSNVSLRNYNPSGAVTYGVYAQNVQLTLDHVTVVASGGSLFVNSIYVYNSALVLDDSSVFASGVGSSYGIYTDGGTPYLASVARTSFYTGSADVYNQAGQGIELAYSRITGSLLNASPGVFSCIGNYNNSLVPITCP